MNSSDTKTNGIDDKNSPEDIANKWKDKIEEATKFERAWRHEARQCRNVYLSKNPFQSAMNTQIGETLATTGSIRRHARNNIFFANVSFSRSSILPRMPEIVIRERYSKENNQFTGQREAYQTVADIVQRAATMIVNTDYNIKQLHKFKDDALITGRGVLWVLFSADTDPMGNTTGERIMLKRIGLDDFRISPAREWEEVSWVARRILLDKKSIKDQYGKEIADKISMSYPNQEDKLSFTDVGVQFESRAEVWEIWDKTKKEVIFVCEGYDKPLAITQDPYGLDGFFPTPEPFLTVPKNDSMIPTPEFAIYRSEAMEVSEISTRISRLVSSMRGRGFVPNTLVKDMNNLRKTNDDGYVLLDGQGATNILDKGLKNVIQFEPIDDKAKVVATLADQLDRQKQTIYEITGLSDAMQISNALATSGGDAETATKTIMKGKFGSIRLQDKQSSFNNYVKEVFGIVVEFICNKFSQQSLQDITDISLNDGMDPADTGITWGDVMSFLQDNQMTKYTLDVETDMNVWESDAEAQQTRAAMVSMFTEQLTKIQEMSNNIPTAIDYFQKSAIFVLNAYQMPSSLRNTFEDVLSAMCQEMKEKAAKDKANPPPPKGQELIAQAEDTKAKAMAEEIKMKGQIEQAKMMLEKQKLDAQSMEIQAKAESEQIAAEVKMRQIELEKFIAQSNFEVAQVKLDMEMRKIEVDMQGSDAKEQAKLAAIKEKLTMKNKQLEMEYDLKTQKMDKDMDVVEATLTQKALSEKDKLKTKLEVEKIKSIGRP